MGLELNAGNNIAARIPMIAITTSSSIRANPRDSAGAERPPIRTGLRLSATVAIGGFTSCLSAFFNIQPESCRVLVFFNVGSPPGVRGANVW